MQGSPVEWFTLVMATIAGAGSLVRIWQNQRSYRLMCKMHKKKKKKKK